MRHVGSLIAVSCVLLCANAAQDDLAKKELDSLQGVWQCTSWVSDGTPAPEKELKGMKLTFKGNKLSMPSFGSKGEVGTAESTIKLDPTKKPKAIDMTDLTTGEKPVLGIYSMEGDVLKISMSNVGGGPRPTEFKAVRDVTMFVLKRAKR